MTGEQIKKLTMYLVLIKYIKETLDSILNLMPKFSDNFTLFEKNVQLLQQQYELQIIKIGGITKNKGEVKNTMSDLALSVSQKVFGYATDINNEELKGKMYYTKSDILKKGDFECMTICELIHDKAKELLPNLDLYFVTADMLDKLQLYITGFGASIPNPKFQKNIKKMATEEINTLFSKQSELLQKMDASVKMLADINPEFVKEYFVNRVLGKVSYRTLAARIRVVDTDGNALPMVEVSNEELKLKRNTTMKGQLYLKTSPDGVYMFSFQKNGYVPEEREVVLQKGIRAEVKVEMKTAT